MITRLLKKLLRPEAEVPSAPPNPHSAEIPNNLPPVVVVQCNHVLRDGMLTVHNDRFLQDPRFRAAYARGVQAGFGVDTGIEWRVHVALWAAATAIRVPGDFVECGVNAGVVSSGIMHRFEWENVPKRFYLIDTFQGPVTAQFSNEEIEAGRLNETNKAIASGGYVTDMDRVRKNYADWPNAIVVQGAIPDILHELPVDQVAFLHIDMNCAYPERAALEFFWPRLSPGAIVLLDDYAYIGYELQAAAMDSVTAALGVSILSLPTGQGLVVKPQMS